MNSHAHEDVHHIPTAVPSIVLNITVTGSSEGVNLLMMSSTVPSVSLTLYSVGSKPTWTASKRERERDS